MTKFIISVSVLAVFVTMSTGSAIPMWEYLSRSEKMSHLYSMFAQQVSSYCKTNVAQPVAHCKRDLLVYGVDKLEKMTDLHLDAMDPYQHGANDIIWDSMMEGHSTKPTKTEKRKPSLSIKQPSGQYAHNPIFDDINDSSSDRRPSASTDAEAYASGMDSMYDTGAYNYPTAAEGVYTETQNYLAAASNTDLIYEHPSETVASNTNFLSGPMVVRVRPDGSPVEEDNQNPLPRDDDREAMTMGKKRMPTVQQISENYRVGSSQSPIRRSATYSNYRTVDRRLTNSH